MLQGAMPPPPPESVDSDDSTHEVSSSQQTPCIEEERTESLSTAAVFTLHTACKPSECATLGTADVSTSTLDVHKLSLWPHNFLAARRVVLGALPESVKATIISGAGQSLTGELAIGRDTCIVFDDSCIDGQITDATAHGAL